MSFNKEIVEEIKKYHHNHEYIGEKVWRRFTLGDRGSMNSSSKRKALRSLVYSPAAFLFTLNNVPLISHIRALAFLFTWNNVPLISHIGALPQKLLREAVGNGTARAKQAKDLYDTLAPLSNAFDAISQLDKEIDVDTKAQVAFLELFKTKYGTDSFTTDFNTLSQRLFNTRTLNPTSWFGDNGKKAWKTVYPFIGANYQLDARQICKAKDIKAFRKNLLSHFKNNFLKYKQNVIEEANKIYGQRISQSGFWYGPSKKLKPLAEKAIDQVNSYDIEYFADKEMMPLNTKTLSTSRLPKMPGE